LAVPFECHYHWGIRLELKYRREIDGLRAVAVLPVIFFHAGFQAFSGGFVGVDVFFVISGYLITTIILADKDKGTFSLVTFYERRARRILPALFFIMFCCVPFAWLWLMPDHLIDFSKSLIAVSCFASNILFWTESGYFATAAELKPLLHTWSLAVEEQYYILFPLFLILVWKLRKRWIFGSLMVLAVTSLALSQWGAYNEPEATFYLLPARVWELAIGALIAIYFLYKKQHIDLLTSKKSVNEAFGMLGIVLILYSIFTFDKGTPFPSFYALIPTIGTGLIIVFSNPQTFVGRLLGTKPMVGIGLISYSAYLWHQPLFVFTRHRSFTEPSVTLLLTLSTLSILLAYLSWRYVEIPFRNKDTFSRKRIFSFAVVGSVSFVAIGLAGQFDNGWSGRIPESTLIAAEQAKEKNPNRELWQRRGPDFFKSPSSYIATDNKETYAYLIGDSHAGALAEEFKKALDATEIGFMASTHRACIPITGVYRSENNRNNECIEHNNSNYSYIESNENIQYVILAARWTLNLEGERFNNGEGGIEFGKKPKLNLIEEGEKKNYTGEELQKKIITRYIDSVKELLKTGKSIILVYPIPEAGWNVPDYITKASFFERTPLEKISPVYGSTSHIKFKQRNKAAIEALDNIGDYHNLFRVIPEKVFCSNDVEGRCIVQSNGVILYKDDDHLSHSGARLVVDEIMSYMR
jgi:peptidoglycan/LPS O-acetylase OafA/YrhL